MQPPGVPMGQTLLDKLAGMEERLIELEGLMADPEVIANGPRLAACVKEHGGLAKFVKRYRELRQLDSGLADAREILDDEESEHDLRDLAREELKELQGQRDAVREGIKALFLSDSPDETRNAIVEIRAGTGGEEAALFAANLFRMYARFAESQRWSLQVLHTHPTDIGGLKEISFLVEGGHAFRKLRHESGGHRVQRVPVTESGGRIHTSLVTVAVLPEAEDVEVEINPADLQIDTFCASGPGGQKVNKTSSAVRITHLPTGIIAQCQECPSQHKNRAQAMRVLRSRLYETAKAKQESERASARRSQVGSGDRSGRIRTYNFPGNRVTDHRIGLTIHALDRILDGQMDDLVNALVEHEIAQRGKTLDFDGAS